MSSVPVYCICGKPYETTRFMIQCDACKEWFHGSCVGLKEHQSRDIDKYHCPKCEKMFGPSIVKQRVNWHRHDYTDVNADCKAVQTGTPVFIKEIKTRHFPSADEIILRLRGPQLTLPYFVQNGFNAPILVESTDGLGLVVPSEAFSIADVERSVGSSTEIDVIDVGRQEDVKMTLREFVDYHNNPNRSKVLNVISLEFSKTSLSELVEAPYIIRKLSWTQNYWPDNLPEECPFTKPEVQKYCLIGAKDSYTDFHIDFGGTSVWYHVLRGEKIFYLIRPTPANLALYERWMSSSNQSETFFGDQVDACYKCVLHQGQTMLIPTGWIHAVLTPADSMVFGGNFLHSLNIPLQLQVNEIEKRIKTPEKYRFPAFEMCHWYAAKHILEELKDYNDSDRKPPAYLIQGTKSLISALKCWVHDKEHLKSHRQEIPEPITYSKLIKDLNREIRHCEKPHLARKSKAKAVSNTKKEWPLEDIARSGVEPPVAFRPDIVRIGGFKTDAKGAVKRQSSEQSPAALNSSGKAAVPTNPEMAVGLKLLISRASLAQENVGLTSQVKKVTVDPGVGKLQEVRNASKNRKMKALNSVNRLSVGDESVYDFRDSDEDNLVVDENPPAKGSSHANLEPKHNPFRLKLSLNGKQLAGLEDIVSQESAEVDVVSSPKLSGIEDLLRASGYGTDSESKFDDDLGSGRASPSTREAIQGMLSISRAIQFNPVTSSSAGSGALSKGGAGGGNSTRNNSRPQRQRRKLSYNDDDGESMSQCHQDEEFIYPTLDISDDEGLVFKSRGRGKRDEAWNPKTKLLPNCPKPERPVREGVKNEAVESGLAAAAVRLAHLPPPKRPYHRKKPVQVKSPPVTEEVDVQPGPSSLSPTQSLKRPGGVLKDNSATKGKKPKKGMATAKQRLGKILKIHKMLY